jgi:putative phosphoesterase
MRVAAIYDIHGNLPALEAVLDEIRNEHIDLVVVGGDVLPGPMPGETIACLRNLDLPVKFLYGNCEVAVLERMAGRDPAAVPEPYRPIINWTAERVMEHQGFLADWPKTLRFQIPGLGDVFFCHGTPRNEDEAFTRLTPEEVLLPIFEGLNASVVVCGHTHMQFDRMIGSTRVVNAGSVGMPFGERGADWLLLGPGIELRHTTYDLAAAAARVRETDYPDAENFAATHILKPPQEAAMLEVFTHAGVK